MAETIIQRAKVAYARCTPGARPVHRRIAVNPWKNREDNPVPSRILETALYAPDLDAAEAFYAGILGLERAARAGDRHVFFRLAEAMLLVFNPAETERPPTGLPVPPHGARGPGHVAFAATGDEIDRWRSRLEAAGVAIEADFTWPGGARSLYVRDPAGNSVELAEPRLWGFAR
jgi:catechol 2,3-dioxygenase-like lactoylglutathione lyase family enzyme